MSDGTSLVVKNIERQRFYYALYMKKRAILEWTDNVVWLIVVSCLRELIGFHSPWFRHRFALLARP